MGGPGQKLPVSCGRKMYFDIKIVRTTVRTGSRTVGTEGTAGIVEANSQMGVSWWEDKCKEINRSVGQSYFYLPGTLNVGAVFSLLMLNSASGGSGPERRGAGVGLTGPLRHVGELRYSAPHRYV